ncbi:MAG: hypothetical protein V3S89_06930 [Desulfobacterales bacterium]
MNSASYTTTRCGECGAKNRIPIDHERSASSGDEKITCGKCHRPLIMDQTQRKGPAAYKMRCTHCGTQNRVPAGKIDSDATCGKCGEPLSIGELFIPQPVMVTDANMEDKVLKSPLPVLLYAWAPW